jgi:hypothetical protein
MRRQTRIVGETHRRSTAGPVRVRPRVIAKGSVTCRPYVDDTRWLRSYVLAEPEGRLGSVCVYQASSEEAARSDSGTPERLRSSTAWRPSLVLLRAALRDGLARASASGLADLVTIS